MCACHQVHALNCRGVVLSWASLGQPGTRHVNNHANEYVIELFESLGYRFHPFASYRMRENRPGREQGLPDAISTNHAWLRHSLLVFERWTPLEDVEGCGCGKLGRRL
jgi:hypothetical protein